MIGDIAFYHNTRSPLNTVEHFVGNQTTICSLFSHLGGGVPQRGQLSPFLSFLMDESFPYKYYDSMLVIFQLKISIWQTQLSFFLVIDADSDVLLNLDQDIKLCLSRPSREVFQPFWRFKVAAHSSLVFRICYNVNLYFVEAIRVFFIIRCLRLTKFVSIIYS